MDNFNNNVSNTHWSLRNPREHLQCLRQTDALILTWQQCWTLLSGRCGARFLKAAAPSPLGKHIFVRAPDKSSLAHAHSNRFSWGGNDPRKQVRAPCQEIVGRTCSKKLSFRVSALLVHDCTPCSGWTWGIPSFHPPFHPTRLSTCQVFILPAVQLLIHLPALDPGGLQPSIPQ